MSIILVATTNPGKLREYEQMLAGVPGARVASPNDIEIWCEVAETGSTMAENALLKARAFHQALPPEARDEQVWVLGDDSGLEVDALNGAPGIYSNRWAGPNTNAIDRNNHLLERLKDIPDEARTARFRCVIALISPGGEEYLVEGVVEGRIAHAPEGSGGFGYDPVFELPDGQRMSQLSPDEKNKLSHRGIAGAKAAAIVAAHSDKLKMNYDQVHARIQKAYDQIAPHYAARNSEMRDGLIDLAAQFLELTGQPAHILDLGCGAGRDMVWFESQGAFVVGADLSTGMLAQARQLVRGPLVQADMLALPFQPERFNGVWCMASLLHLPKSEAPSALTEIKRILKPSGTLALGLHEGEGETWEVNPYHGSAERFFSRYQLDEVEELLVSNGFRVLLKGANTAGPRNWLRFLAASS